MLVRESSFSSSAVIGRVGVGATKSGRSMREAETLTVARSLTLRSLPSSLVWAWTPAEAARLARTHNVRG